MDRQELIRQVSHFREVVKDILEVISELDYITIYAKTEEEKKGLNEGRSALINMYRRYVNLIYELQKKLDEVKG